MGSDEWEPARFLVVDDLTGERDGVSLGKEVVPASDPIPLDSLEREKQEEANETRDFMFSLVSETVHGRTAVPTLVVRERGVFGATTSSLAEHPGIGLECSSDWGTRIIVSVLVSPRGVSRSMLFESGAVSRAQRLRDEWRGSALF